ncbi:hypothetical protein U1Q18_002876 [Sarracenia purpurea var. burkii]
MLLTIATFSHENAATDSLPPVILSYLLLPPPASSLPPIVASNTVLPHIWLLPLLSICLLTRFFLISGSYHYRRYQQLLRRLVAKKDENAISSSWFSIALVEKQTQGGSLRGSLVFLGPCRRYIVSPEPSALASLVGNLSSSFCSRQRPLWLHRLLFWCCADPCSGSCQLLVAFVVLWFPRD